MSDCSVAKSHISDVSVNDVVGIANARASMAVFSSADMSKSLLHVLCKLEYATASSSTACNNCNKVDTPKLQAAPSIYRQLNSFLALCIRLPYSQLLSPRMLRRGSSHNPKARPDPAMSLDGRAKVEETNDDCSNSSRS